MAQGMAQLLPDPAALGLNDSSGVIFQKKIIDVDELIHRSALPRVRVDSAKSLVVDQTHPVLARGKLFALQNDLQESLEQSEPTLQFNQS